MTTVTPIRGGDAGGPPAMPALHELIDAEQQKITELQALLRCTSAAFEPGIATDEERNDMWSTLRLAVRLLEEMHERLDGLSAEAKEQATR